METKVTLLATDTNSTRRWNLTDGSNSRLMAVPAFRMVRRALEVSVSGVGHHEIERVIIDGTIDSTAFLEMLSTLPLGFRGDVLYINCDEKAFLSATGRGDDRVLYALNDSDLQFYLEINHLEPMLQLVPQLKIALADFTEAVM